MGYSYTIFDTINKVDEREWKRLCHDDSDPFMDPRFIRVVERTMSDVATFSYVVFRDSQQKPVAIACLYCYLFDVSLIYHGWVKKVVQIVQRPLPFLKRLKLMICGLPVPMGQSNLRFATDADTASVLRSLDEIIHDLAVKQRAKCVLFIEFSENECVQLAPLLDLGYMRRDAAPMNLARGDYPDFDAYCSGVKSRKRSTLQRSRKKFAASGLRVIHRTAEPGMDRVYTEDVHALYKEVLAGKGTLDVLPADFFRELATEMPDETVFTSIEDEERVVAFAASLRTSTAFHQMVVGFDYDVNPTCDLYFNLFYNVMDFAFRQDVSHIFLGQTSDTFKMQKLSATQEPLYVYVKSLNWLVSLFLRT